MRGSIHTHRKGRLLQGAALLISFLFLTGQLFNCCRLNESFGTALKNAFLAAAHTDHKTAHLNHEEGVEAHHKCHGHGSEASPESGRDSKVQGEAGTCAIEQPNECLSEHSFSGKPMLASELALSQTFISVPDVAVGNLVPEPFYFERPRPQNKSSPPLFLITLRILV
jgi:hypothetical protein